MRRMRVILPIAVSLLAIGVLLFGGLAGNLVYFRTVSEAVESRVDDGSDRMRLAGAVVPGSVETRGQVVSFQLTDGVATVDVEHRGDPPELFDDGVPVVSEGRWLGAVFTSDRLMIKHGSDYEAPEVDDGEDAGVRTARADIP